MLQKILRLAIMACLATAQFAFAQQATEKSLPLDGNIAQTGTRVELSWFDAMPPRVGSITVNRRLYGQTGGESWQTIATDLGPIMRYSDDTVKPGVAYEYQVLRTARDIVDVGYWVAGVEIPAKNRRGNLYLVVEKMVAEKLTPRLARFERDLTGDGWNVSRYETTLGDSGRPAENLKIALQIKEWLRKQYSADPFGQHAVVLVGHIPMIASGRVNPDGHGAVPHPSDLFYAEMDGKWSGSPEGLLFDNLVPSNFIEMQVGRIDLIYISNSDRDAEMDLLRAYFDKNHHWRMGLIGDLRQAYGQSDYLLSEQYSLRNVIGAQNLTKGGHHDAGEEKPWLWGVDFGDYNGHRYAVNYSNKAVFAINFGSGKQRLDIPYNPMTTLLAQPWYTVAVGWGARPSWWLHHMALGGTVGDVHMRTVNNGDAARPYRETMDYFPTGRYLWRNPIWVNLLGDPTLRAFPMAPPSNVTVHPLDQGVRLSWTASADTDVTGYRVYRASEDQSTFSPLSDEPVRGLQFTDKDGEIGMRYMIRAHGLKDVHAGSFYTLSQGAFNSDTSLPEAEMVQDMQIETTSTQPVTLPAVFNTVTGGKIYAVIEAPGTGQLKHVGKEWVFRANAGFTGTVALRFSVSDAWHTSEGVLTIKVEG